MGIFSTLGLKNPGVTLVDKLAQSKSPIAKGMNAAGGAANAVSKMKRGGGGGGWANGGMVHTPKSKQTMHGRARTGKGK